MRVQNYGERLRIHFSRKVVRRSELLEAAVRDQLLNNGYEAVTPGQATKSRKSSLCLTARPYIVSRFLR